MLELLMSGNREKPTDASAAFQYSASEIDGGNSFWFMPAIHDGYVGALYRWEISGPASSYVTSPKSGTFTGPGHVTVNVDTAIDDGTVAFEGEFVIRIFNVATGELVGENDYIRITYLEVPTGQQEFIVTGTHQFVVPEGVHELSAVAIGGGQGAFDEPRGRGGFGADLRWANGIEVEPGVILTVTVGEGGKLSTSLNTRNGKASSIYKGDNNLLTAAGGGLENSTPITLTKESGNWVIPTDGFVVGGGDGGVPATVADDTGPSGGGGAGGYLGNGGRSGSLTQSAGDGQDQSGAAGGGAYYYTDTNDSHHATAGGGVGLRGRGATGVRGERNEPMSGGKAGSNGSDGTWTTAGLYGGGAKGRSSNNNFGAVNGANGAVRIIWGVGRRYPSTNTGNL